ncbi:DNA methyltransferase [candidate division GN15 bacterium]|nr:DNA methyltransferase [candidate division GN15 bacterium]
MTDRFHALAVATIRRIPEGRVATYGQVATLCGNPRAARQVVRVLHSCSENEQLPWHRVINAKGRISLSPGRGYELQQALLSDEGVEFRLDGSIDLQRFGWDGR